MKNDKHSGRARTENGILPKLKEGIPPDHPLAFLLKERWLAIKDYEGFYEISNRGRVRSLDRTITTIMGVVRYLTGGMMSVKGHNHGYNLITLCRDGEERSREVARLVAQAFIPNPKNKPQVNHKDGNKADNSVGNLEWSTAQENTAHGRHVLGKCLGEECGASKLTKVQVRQIRHIKRNPKPSCRTIGLMYGVSDAAINDIVNDRTWKGV